MAGFGGLEKGFGDELGEGRGERFGCEGDGIGG